MVSLKEKSRLGSTRASVGVGGQSRPSVGVRNLKVFSEKDQTQAVDGIMTSAREVGAASRSAIAANRRVLLNSASNPKGGLKTLEKKSSKYGASANTNVRKALADVTNAQGNSATASRCNTSKIKIPAGSTTKTAGISLRKSIMGGKQRNTSQVEVQLDALGRGLRASLDSQRNNTNGGQSLVVTKDRFARKPILPTTTRTARTSLPVPRRVNRADVNNPKENAESSETAKGQTGLPNKATADRRVSSQLTNARSHLWKTRVSDGFVQTVKTNVLQASSRKFTKPIVKTTLKASTSQRTSKSSAPVSSKDEEISLSENSLVVVCDNANQRHEPSDRENYLRTDLSECIPKKKTRRKSYTSSLMEGTKLLKENGEVGEQDNLPNIDDECNHLEVSDYIDEIYNYYWVSEAQSKALANYMSIQTEITPQMRSILINWLIEVHFRFDLMPETLYLTITLLDQYLSQVTIKRTDSQLVGLTTLLLASKYEDFWHPRVKDLISTSAEAYTRDQMLEMEKLILRQLKFRLNTPTPYVFMVRFLKAAQSDKKLEHMAFFLIDLSIIEYEALEFKPSLLCASALYVARCTLQITPPWTPLLEKHARYGVSEMRGCADMILKFHKAAGRGKFRVTYEKYSRQELSKVAEVKPLDRLPY